MRDTCYTITLLLFIQQPRQDFSDSTRHGESEKTSRLNIVRPRCQGSEPPRNLHSERRFAKYLRNEENISTYINYSWYYLSCGPEFFLGIAAPIYIQKHYSTMGATMTSLTHGWSFSVSVYLCPQRDKMLLMCVKRERCQWPGWPPLSDRWTKRCWWKVSS